jgi:hypothetical protein
VKEYELYVPLTYNDGSPVDQKQIERIGERLLEQFGGLTFSRSETRASGRWAV